MGPFRHCFNPPSEAHLSSCPASTPPPPRTLIFFSVLLLFLPPLPECMSDIWLYLRNFQMHGGSTEKRNKEHHKKRLSLVKRRTMGWWGWHRGPGRPKKIKLIVPTLQANWVTFHLSFTIYGLYEHEQAISLGLSVSHQGNNYTSLRGLLWEFNCVHNVYTGPDSKMLLLVLVPSVISIWDQQQPCW